MRPLGKCEFVRDRLLVCDIWKPSRQLTRVKSRRLLFSMYPRGRWKTRVQMYPRGRWKTRVQMTFRDVIRKRQPARRWLTSLKMRFNDLRLFFYWVRFNVFVCLFVWAANNATARSAVSTLSCLRAMLVLKSYYQGTLTSSFSNVANVEQRFAKMRIDVIRILLLLHQQFFKVYFLILNLASRYEQRVDVMFYPASPVYFVRGKNTLEARVRAIQLKIKH